MPVQIFHRSSFGSAVRAFRPALVFGLIASILPSASAFTSGNTVYWITLKGANTYTGMTDIYSGTLIVDGGSITNTIDGSARIRLYQPDSTFRGQSGTVSSYGIPS